MGAFRGPELADTAMYSGAYSRAGKAPALGRWLAGPSSREGRRSIGKGAATSRPDPDRRARIASAHEGVPRKG